MAEGGRSIVGNEYWLKKIDGEFSKLRRSRKLTDVLREIFEIEGNVMEMSIVVEDEEYYNQFAINFLQNIIDVALTRYIHNSFNQLYECKDISRPR